MLPETLNKTLVAQDGITLQLGWAGVGIIVAILGHAAFTIWHTATFKTTIVIKIDNLVHALSRMDAELQKRDNTIQAAWKKIDDIGNRLIIVETQIKESQ